MDADLGKSALMHIARLMNSLAKGLKRIVKKIAVYGAAEVFIVSAEELKHTEANPMCSIHWSRVSSC